MEYSLFEPTIRDGSPSGAPDDLHGDTGYLRPCPFSPNYQVPLPQAWKSMALFVLYRIGLGIFLVVPIWIGKANVLWSIHDSLLFLAVALAYLLSALFGIPLLLQRRPRFGTQVQIQVLADIVLISALMKASGGVASGLGILLACSVASGGILAGGRCALGFAAAASLAVLTQELLLVFGALPSPVSSTSAGLLGAAFFAISLLAIALSRRAEQSQILAARHRHDLVNLKSLNTFIVNHLQSGIIVLDENKRVRMANPAAQRLLVLTGRFSSLEQAGPAFRRAYLDWLDGGPETVGIGASADGHSVQVRFARLPQTDNTLSMVILEDNALHQRRVQQSKLKSLSQLTASIAHEIRNPLSAIHQAAQLLNETPCLAAEDGHLIRIILKHARRVNEVIENITQMARRRASQRECIVLGPWLHGFLADFADEHRLTPCPFTVKGSDQNLKALVDPSQLKQILENLCSNALRYGQPDRFAPEIELHRDARDCRPCIDVIDHGSGIDSAIADQIFEPFFTTSHSGTGLGLYIARELAELNQARLEYRPRATGNSFRVSLADGHAGAVEL